MRAAAHGPPSRGRSPPPRPRPRTRRRRTLPPRRRGQRPAPAALAFWVISARARRISSRTRRTVSSESRVTNSPIGASAGAAVSISSTAIDCSSLRASSCSAVCDTQGSETATREASESPFRTRPAKAHQGHSRASVDRRYALAEPTTLFRSGGPPAHDPNVSRAASVESGMTMLAVRPLRRKSTTAWLIRSPRTSVGYGWKGSAQLGRDPSRSLRSWHSLA